ncbi:MAG TPA: universal stress protein [Candidatus Angelobacter sp.]|nr:universal stress protein [Candidatus Angelobacter sp.]
MNAAVIVPIVPAIQLKRILYATDFSEGSREALPVVCAIARRYDSEVLLAHVSPHVVYPLVTPEVLLDMNQKREREATQEFEELVRVTAALHISAKPILKSGEPVDELERIVREKGVDLVILSTHGRLGIKHMVMGSVAEALFRKLACPVLTVGPHLDKRFLNHVEIKNILFPTDLSEESRAVFPYLASLAHEYHAKITLLHVLPMETRSNPDARRLAEPLRAEMQRIFAPAISPECQAEFVIESGDAAERILQAGRAADLIGFGVRKAGEVTNHLRNTVTYRVLVNATCPVLTSRYPHQW